MAPGVKPQRRGKDKRRSKPAAEYAGAVIFCCSAPQADDKGLELDYQYRRYRDTALAVISR
jgi:hypothetical protein